MKRKPFVSLFFISIDDDDDIVFKQSIASSKVGFETFSIESLDFYRINVLYVSLDDFLLLLV